MPRVLSLLAMIVVQVVVLAMSMVVLVLCFGLGLVFLFPPQAMAIRRLAERTRRIAGIASPYRPPPPPPRPGADGWYRSDRTLYKTPRIPAWNNRWKWLLHDPQTWRDAFWLLLDPPVKVLMAPMLLLVPGRGLRVYRAWAELLLGHTESSRLAGEVRHLTQVRSLVNDSQAAEMRRIERDLHDGTQARLVALGLTLGAVEELVDKDPAAARALVVKAREASAEALVELRRVVRGIHPPVLAERGLADAVRALALDCPLPVEVTVDLAQRPSSPVEAAAYFAVSELLNNAVRHADATSVRVDVSHRGPDLRITVTDDGHGGADPDNGSGLYGIERRLAAFDGVVALNSPPGGPTTVTLEFPKVLSDHWASALPRMPRWKAIVVATCWLTAWLPTFPQGIVAGVLKALAVPEKSWFLALHLPEPWQWPMIVFMILLGASMYVLASLLSAQAVRA
ncbi:histidine kinase [Nonomuraea sp. NPDC050310]|uniref:sensor histidine kinase n=1 Tax=Nonomuraea sp. NPDC050310 TaxID=3154935 RepID=UPI0033DB9F87